MELVDIVDKDGNFTGQVMDKEEAHDKNLLHNGVVIFIVNNKNQVLLGKRSAFRKFNPNKWELIGGHVTCGETLEEAALREVKEEIGISFTLKDLFSLDTKEIEMLKDVSHIFYFYYIKCNLLEKDFIIQKEELSEVKWFNINEIINMIKDKREDIVFNEKRIPIFEKLKDLG